MADRLLRLRALGALLALSLVGATHGQATGVAAPPGARGMRAGPATGTRYYVDPVRGSMANNGRTPLSAWRTFEEVADYGYLGTRVQAGDSLVLMTGNHGNVHLRDLRFPGWLYVVAGSGETPVLQSLRGFGIEHFHFDGLTFTPSIAGFYTDQDSGVVWIGADGPQGWSRFIRMSNCRIFSVIDSSHWSQSDWRDLPSDGVSFYLCTDVEFVGNDVFNVFRGVKMTGTHMRIAGNRIDKFSGDGIYGGGVALTVEDNVVTNCFDVSAFHNDGIQFYSGNRGNRELIVRRNVVIASTSPLGKPSGHMQGITCFDQGGAQDSVVENNLVISNTQDGIAFYFRNTNCRFINNTVYGFMSDGFGSPMRIYGNCSGSIVRNNLTTNLLADASAQAIDHNLVIFDPTYAKLVFVDPAQSDFRLSATSLAIDSGNDQDAPATDFEGDPRPQGKAVDIGADEAR